VGSQSLIWSRYLNTKHLYLRITSNIEEGREDRVES
jgi:hypothetical protein